MSQLRPIANIESVGLLTLSTSAASPSTAETLSNTRAASTGHPTNRAKVATPIQTATGQLPSLQAQPVTAVEYGVQELLFGVVLGVIIGAIAALAIRYWNQRHREDQVRIEWFWIGLAILGAAGHAFFVDIKFGYRWEPIFDTTTLLWLATAAVGLLYPRISEITMGTFGIKLKDAVSDVSELVSEALDITDRWANRLNEALVEFPPKEPGELSESVAQFLREAAKDATEWFGKDGELRRLSYWIYEKEKDELGIYLSNEITPEDNPELYKRRLKAGEGLAGKALKDEDPLNLSNAPADPRFLRIRGSHPRYRGMLIVAIPSGPSIDDRLGVICVDRSLQEKFPKSSVKLIEALAAMTGMLLGQPEIKTKLKSL